VMYGFVCDVCVFLGCLYVFVMYWCVCLWKTMFVMF
jgi:hypothetical protein